MHYRTFLFLLLGPLLGATEPIVPELKFTEVSRKEVHFGDYTMTLIRVRAPVLPVMPVATTPAAPRPLTAEEQAYEERMSKKAYASLQVSAVVYLGGQKPVTELRWCNDVGDIEYRAWSNIDFRYLTPLTQLETASTVYAWSPFIYACDVSELPAGQKSPLALGLDFSSTEPEYFVEARAEKLKSEEITLAGLDYLHAYYQLHYADLKADYEKREALAAAAEKELREHPPKTPDATFRFWPIKSRVNPR